MSKNVEYKFIKSYKLCNKFKKIDNKIEAFEYHLKLINFDKEVRLYLPIYLGKKLSFSFIMKLIYCENNKKEKDLYENDGNKEIFSEIKFIGKIYLKEKTFKLIFNFNYEIQKEINEYFNNYSETLLSYEELIANDINDTNFNFLVGTTYLFSFIKNDKIDYDYMNDFIEYQKIIKNNEITKINKKYKENLIFSNDYLYLSKFKTKKKYLFDFEISVDDNTLIFFEKLAERSNIQLSKILDSFEIEKILKDNNIDNLDLNKSINNETYTNDINKCFKNNLEMEFKDFSPNYNFSQYNESDHIFFDNKSKNLNNNENSEFEILKKKLKNLKIKDFLELDSVKEIWVFNIYINDKENYSNENSLKSSNLIIASFIINSKSLITNNTKSSNYSTIDFLNIDIEKNKYVYDLKYERNIKSFKIFPKIDFMKYFIDKNDYIFFIQLQNIFNGINKYSEAYFFKKYLKFTNLIEKDIDLNNKFFNIINSNKDIFINKAMNLKEIDENFNIESFESFGDSVIKLLVVLYFYKNYPEEKLVALEHAKRQFVMNAYFQKLIVKTNYLAFLRTQNFNKMGKMGFHHQLFKDKKEKYKSDEIPNFHIYNTRFSLKNLSDFFESLIGLITLLNNNFDIVINFLFNTLELIPLNKIPLNFEELKICFYDLLDINLIKEYYKNNVNKFKNNLNLSITNIYSSFNKIYINNNEEFNLDNLKLISDYKFKDKKLFYNSFTTKNYLNDKNEEFEKLEFWGDAIWEFFNQFLTINIGIHLGYDLNQQQLHKLKNFMNSRYTQSKVFVLSGIYLCCYELNQEDQNIKKLKNFLKMDRSWADNYLEGEINKCISDYFESFAGAIFLDGKFQEFFKFYFNIYFPLLIYSIININDLELLEDKVFKINSFD